MPRRLVVTTPASTEKVIAAGSAAFPLSGQLATLRRGLRLSASPTSFPLSGQAATFRLGKSLVAGAASFPLSGQVATLRTAKKIAADPASFPLTGQAATLTKSGGVPTLVNSATTNGTGSTVNINMPASVTAGNKLGFIFGCAGNESGSTPSGWTLVAHATSGGTAGTDRRLYYFEKTGSAAGTEGGTTIALTVGGTAGSFMAISFQVAGSATTTLSATATATGTNPDGPILNPGSSAATLWATMAAKREAVGASAAPSGYSGLVVSRNSNVSGMLATKTATASSEDPGTFSGFSVSDNYAAITLGFRT